MPFRSNIVPPLAPSHTHFVSRPFPTISPPIHLAPVAFFSTSGAVIR